VQKRRGLSPEGRERVRAAALAHQPWRYSTGPRTAAGKAKSAANGKTCQKGEPSVRGLRAELAEVWRLIGRMRDGREQLGGG
jgi:hypothetical protein